MCDSKGQELGVVEVLEWALSVLLNKNSNYLLVGQQIFKEALRQGNPVLHQLACDILAARNRKEALTKVLSALKKFRSFWKKGVQESFEATLATTAKETAKEGTEALGKQVSIKTAKKLANESSKKVFKNALKIGAVVDGIVCAVEIGYAIKQYRDGNKTGDDLCRDSLCSVSSAAGSTVAGAGGAWIGTWVGAFAGSIFPVVGTAAGAAVGGFIGSFGGGIAGSYAGKCGAKKLLEC